MKLLLLAGLIFSINISAKAVDVTGGDCVECAGKLRGAPGLADSVQKIADKVKEPGRKVAKVKSTPATTLAQNICMMYSVSGESIVSDIKNLIVKHMQGMKKPIKNPSKGQIIEFLNKNRHQMICADGKNFLKHAFDRGVHNAIFQDLFLGELVTDDEKFIDFNAVDNSSGVPKTIVDYTDDIIASGTYPEAFVFEVTALRRMLLEDLGAVRFDDLPFAERQLHIQMYAGR